MPSLANGGISPDGKRVVYHLRRDVSWQDGATLNSRDVVFTYRAIMGPSNTVSLAMATTASLRSRHPIHTR